MTSAAVTPIFGVASTLPRGPHHLSRAEVAASQRTRLLTALAEVVATEGYAATTIGAIVRAAGVSRTAFYEHFADKEQCFLAAYDAFVAMLQERIGAELAPGTDEWHAVTERAIGSYLAALDESVVVSRAFLVEIDAAGPAARRRRRLAHREFADIVRAGHDLVRQQNPGVGVWPDVVYLAIVDAINEAASDTLEMAPGTPLTTLQPELTAWLTHVLTGPPNSG